MNTFKIVPDEKAVRVEIEYPLFLKNILTTEHIMLLNPKESLWVNANGAVQHGSFPEEDFIKNPNLYKIIEPYEFYHFARMRAEETLSYITELENQHLNK